MIQYVVFYFKNGKSIFCKKIWATSFNDAKEKAENQIDKEYYDYFNVEEF